jgi:hypothetical protein
MTINPVIYAEDQLAKIIIVSLEGKEVSLSEIMHITSNHSAKPVTAIWRLATNTDVDFSNSKLSAMVKNSLTGGTTSP